ncbi:FAD-dependent oxidoreductase [Agrobacterium tumefaciens]|uniref:FAD-dependent oxidoreductase n=1 Tax=Agrobacterium tumefaciens TaxID=358 RepID=UPI001ADAC490|nr:FAD-dependent oxidoreductase [Agrobacterium tumefaciens]
MDTVKSALGDDSGAAQHIRTTIAIAGGGPAGVMLGLLLARSGIDVVVVEKHGDFLRDFRGDTIHPSTLDLIEQLGFIDEFLSLPHTRAPALHAVIGGERVTIADFSRLPVRHRFIAFMPQWDFLNFLVGKAGQYENFRLLMNAPVTGLVERGGKVGGIRIDTPQGEIEIEADLVVGADGRSSVVREAAGLEVQRFGVPTEVLWMRLSKQPGDPKETMGHAGPRQGFVMIDRGDYWQCGYVVRKGFFADIKLEGIEAFRRRVAEICPFPRERLDELKSWDDIYLLTVRIDRLKRWWKPGLICIGDAAHAMSPVGGVGVNLAVQDAVAAANVLVPAVLSGRGVSDDDLAAIENRRSFPTKATQFLQRMMRVGRKNKQVDDAEKKKGPPAFVLAIMRFPFLAHLTGRLVGLGFRRETIHTI